MGRSKKRKRTTRAQQRIDGGILQLLYPTSRLCTLHDLLVSLLFPSLQHASSRTASKELALQTAASGVHTPQVANTDAGHTMRARVQAVVPAYMGVNIQPTVASGNVDMWMQQAAIGADIASPDVGAQQVQLSKVAMYSDDCEAAMRMPRKDMAAKQTMLGADLSRQHTTTMPMDKAVIAAAAHSLLVREGDSADYLHLLSHGYGVLPDTAPPLGHTMLEQRWTHQQVIERAIQILFKQGKSSSNVLCFGFQQPRPSSCLKRDRTAPAGLACVSDNAAVTVLNSQTWRTIHARVGDSIMLHLLSYADVFQPLPHKCYVQVAGTSVLLSALQNKTPEQYAVHATEIPTGKQNTSWKKQRVERSKDIERGVGLVDVGAHMNIRNRHYGTGSSMHHEVMTRNHRRPHSWQRWKARKLYNKQAEQTYVGAHTNARNGNYVTEVSMHHQVMTRKRRRPHSWQRRKARKLIDKQTEQDNGFNVVKERTIYVEPNEQEFVMRASEMCLASSLDIVEDSLATQEEIVAVLGAQAVTQANDHNNDRSHDSRQMPVFGKSIPYEKMKNDWLNIPVPGHFSQHVLSYSTATMYKRSNDSTKDRKKQRTDGFSTSSLFANPAFGTQSERVLKESKGGNSGMPLERSTPCITGGYLAGRGGGRRLVNRTRMFYKSKFPRHAGLPKNHLLQRLRSSYKDATILFEAVFGKESICKIESFGEYHVLHSEICCKCIFCLLKKLISNARRCQFSRFLKRHCSPCSKSRIQSKESAKDLNLKVGINVKKHADHDISKGRSDGVMKCAVFTEGTCKTPAGRSLDGIGKVLVEEENNSFSSHSQVVAFVWAVCRRIVPVELLGSRKNWRNLRRNIFAFVSLRRHESFSLEQCMFKLKLRGYHWCQEGCFDGYSLCREATGRSSVQKETEDDSKSNSQHASARGGHKKTNRSFQILRRKLFEKWMYWLFSGLIVPLIQAHFYVTESEKYKQNVLFYRKSVWAKIKANAVKEMMKWNFKRLRVKSTANLLKQGSLGFSRARLLPKKSGMRLIANLGSSSAIPGSYAHDEVGKIKKRRGKHGNLLRSYNCKVGMTKVPREKKYLIFKPINFVLRDLHHCLKYEQEEHAEDLGCSVFDYNDAYLKLLPYIIGQKQASNGAGPLYLVVCDVLQAFDTIKQEKLIEILQEFVREEEYCVMRYGYASPHMNSIKVLHERSAMSTVSGMTSLDIFLQLAAKQRNAVCIDQAYAVKLKRSHIFEVLKEHILRNIIQIGQHFYLQIVGIPQGSILSSLLCSLYYGHFEISRLARTLHLEHRLNSSNQASMSTNKIFKASSSLMRGDYTSVYLESRSIARSMELYSVNGSVDSNKCSFAQSNETGGQNVSSPLSFKCLRNATAMTEDVQHRNIMLRLVDDWLFISNSQDDALEFVRKMHRGFVDFNCVANRLKTAVSFDAVLGGSPLKMNVYRTQDGACYIRWSGLLINCNTLEVQADYTRYCGVELRSTLTVWRRNNQGYYLMTKLCQFMRPKCHPIFYDANINSPATAFLNAYQAFLLCAMKFHAYNCSLPCGSSSSPEFGFRAIQKSARYMHSLLAHRTGKISKSSKVKPLLMLHAKEMQWLALCAFHKVLMRKQSRYVRLLYLLKTELHLPKYTGLGESPLMVSTLDPRRSSMFEDIIY